MKNLNPYHSVQLSALWSIGTISLVSVSVVFSWKFVLYPSGLVIKTFSFLSSTVSVGAVIAMRRGRCTKELFMKLRLRLDVRRFVPFELAHCNPILSCLHCTHRAALAEPVYRVGFAGLTFADLSSLSSADEGIVLRALSAAEAR
jgi:hypothetical protein